MAVEGIIEDMTHIILNFKSALLRRLATTEDHNSRDITKITQPLEVTQAMIDSNGGQYAVKLSDVFKDPRYEVVNPELVLFTATTPMSRNIVMKIATGRGYVPSERHMIEDQVADEIVVDSKFSPVKLVNYFVENTRVGRDTDYDRLVLEVHTDGRVTPKEALTFSTQISILHFEVFDEMKFESLVFDQGDREDVADEDTVLNKLCLRINEIELSVRSTNCLSQADIDTIAELVIMPESDMLRFRNFGKKSLNEIKAKLEEMNLHLGMDLSQFGMTKENVKEKIQELINERANKES
jgi:DNA-directed RNA polymerase subunit alpha